jgi:hypothetical protein
MNSDFKRLILFLQMKILVFSLSVSIALFVSGCSSPQTGDKGLSPFGVLVHLEGGGENNEMIGHLDLLQDMGARWNRTDFSWGDIESTQGTWTFDTHDRIVDRLVQHHIQPMGILLYDVAWAHPAHLHLDAWLTYVEKTVTRYKDRVRHWEVWNEPNLIRFWENPDGGDYATLLQATYAKIKEIDPELTVIYAGTSGIPLAFIEESFKAGAANSFDRMAFHPYRGTFNSMKRITEYYSEVSDLQRLLEKYNVGDKKLWITEMGLSTWETVSAASIEEFYEMKERKTPGKEWKIALLYDENNVEGNTMTDDEIMALFENRKGIHVENLHYPDVTTVDVSPYDAVLSPLMEDYPAQMFETISPSLGYFYFVGRMYFYGKAITEEDQAAFVPQALLLSMRFGVERFVWYEFHSSERNPFEREGFFSLVHHRNLEPKPAYYTYRTLTEVFPEGSRMDTSVEWNRKDFCLIRWIHPDGTPAWAVWTPSGKREASVKIGKGLRQALNHKGEALPVTTDTQTLELSPGITYLIGAKTLEIQ